MAVKPPTTLRIEQPLLARLDTIAEQKGIGRSELMVYALRVYCDAWDSAHAPLHVSKESPS